MGFTVNRKYDNGMSVTVQGETIQDVLQDLSLCDEVFRDLTCYVKDESGKTVKSDDVVFRVRHTDHGPYYEHVCVAGGPFQGYKRHIGEYQDKKKGMFVKRHVDEKDRVNHAVGGYGWKKYVGGESSGNYSNSQQSYQQPQQSYQQPQQSYQQAPPQQAPPQQSPVQQPAYQPAADIDDIPF